MKRTEFLCLILCFCMLTFLVACTEDTETESLSESSEATESETVSYSEHQNEKGEYVAKTSGNRYDGQTITFLTCSESLVYESEIVENIKTYEDGAARTYPQVINDDLRIRAETLERELGLKLEEMQLHSPARKNGEMLQAVVRGNLSSTTEYQVVVPCLYDGATLAVQGQLHDLLGIDGLQMDAP